MTAPHIGIAGALFAEHALLPGGWARDVLLQWDASGRLLAVAPGSAPGSAPRAPGPLLPGMPNLHSHAFQRAFAGLTEYRAESQDSFWSWRNLMYRFAAHIAPEQPGGHCHLALCRDAGGRLHLGVRIPLPAPRPDGPALCRRRRAGPSPCCAPRRRRASASRCCPCCTRPVALAACRPRGPGALHPQHRLHAAPACSAWRPLCKRKRASWAWRRIRCARCRPTACAKPLLGSTALDARRPPSTSTSPSRRKRSTTASPGAASARCSGCWTTRLWMPAGASCTPPT